jgi:recombination protein RecA
VAAPFRTTEFDIMYNEGISMSGDLLDTAVLHRVINKTGNSYSFGEEKLGVGREKAKDYLKASPPLMKKIKSALWEAVERGEAPEEEEGKAGAKESIEE